MPKPRGQPGPGNAAVKHVPPRPPPPCILGFLPSFLAVFENPAEPGRLFLPGPLPSVAIGGLQVGRRSAPNLNRGISVELERQKNLSRVWTAETWGLGNRPPGCRLLALHGARCFVPRPPSPSFPLPRAGFRTFQVSRWVSVPHPRVCHLQMAGTL